MTGHRELLSKVRRWKQRHDISISSDDFEQDEVHPVKEQSMTGIFYKKKVIDHEMMFNEPASRSQKLHDLNQKQADPIIGQLLMEQWATFFECFRDDEHDFEEAEFVDSAHSVQNRLDRLPPHTRPDIVTLRQMLFLLIRLTREQFERRNERINELMNRVHELEFEKESVQLENCWHIDEIHRCMHIISCQMRGEDIPLKDMDEKKTSLHSILMAFLKNKKDDTF